MTADDRPRSQSFLVLIEAFERIGRAALTGIQECGYAAALFAESVYWTVVGRRWRQPVLA